MCPFMEWFLAPPPELQGAGASIPSILAGPCPVGIESPWCSAWKSRRTARSPVLPSTGPSRGLGPTSVAGLLGPWVPPMASTSWNLLLSNSQPRPPAAPAARTSLLDQLLAPPHSWERERSPRNPPPPQKQQRPHPREVVEAKVTSASAFSLSISEAPLTTGAELREH